MSERINDRWRQLNEVYIPPIRRPGFESNVLKRDIWDQSAAQPPQQAGADSAPMTAADAKTDVFEETASAPKQPDAPDAPLRYAPAADPWETEAPEQIPDDIWEDPVGADAPAKAVPAQAAAPAAEPLQPAVPVFEIPAEPAEPEIFIEPEAPVQPMPAAEEAVAEPAEPVQPEPAPVKASPVEPQPEPAEPVQPEPVMAEPAPVEAAAVSEPAEPVQPAPVIPEVPAEPEIFVEPEAPVQPEPAEPARPVQPDPAIDDIFVQQKAPEPDYYEEGTVLLSDGGIRLVRVKDPSEVICVTGDSFILGKSRKADYSIGGNPAISRIHAHIYRIGNDYYIEDRNSLNHTYVDEEMITGPYKLRNGLVIRLANEDFILKMD